MGFPREGKFRVEILDCGLNKSDKGYVRLTIRTRAYAEYMGDGWYDVSGENIISTDYIWLSGKNGLNLPKVRDLAEAIGWDGISMATLAHGAKYAGVIIQADVQGEVYNDKTTNKIQWIRHSDSPVGIRKADDATVQSLVSEFDRQLRNMKLAAKSAAPRPAATPNSPEVTAAAAVAIAAPPRPAPVRPTPQRPAAPAAPSVPATADGAWNHCVEIWTAQGCTDQAMMQAEWISLLQEAVRGKDEMQFTADDWAAVMAHAPKMLTELSLLR